MKITVHFDEVTTNLVKAHKGRQAVYTQEELDTYKLLKESEPGVFGFENLASSADVAQAEKVIARLKGIAKAEGARLRQESMKDPRTGLTAAIRVVWMEGEPVRRTTVDQEALRKALEAA